MALRTGKRLASFCCLKQSTVAKEKEEMVITHLSSSEYELETKDVSICKQM